MPITNRFVVRSTILLLSIGFLTLLVIVGMTLWLGERARLHFDEALRVRDTRGAAVELRDALRTAESSQRGYLLTGNEIYLAPFDNAKVAARGQLALLARHLAADADAAPMARRLSGVVGEKIDEIDRTVLLGTERRTEEAMAIVRTNRGKALMDEANVFLHGIILAADERLTAGIHEQRVNATLLRWVSTLGGIVIILVIGGVTATILQYAREIGLARDEVNALNVGLEERVARRTADLARARDRAEVLLAEVNHRVANSLALVASLIQLQANAVRDEVARDALAETQERIHAIALIHRRLYGSGDARFVALDEYLGSLLDHLGSSMRAEGRGASLRYEVAPLTLTTDASVNLGVIVAEWVTNAFKYAYPDRPGEVRVRVAGASGRSAELVVEDDGVGRGDSPTVKGTGLGTRIVNAMAASMGAEIRYTRREPGTAAHLLFSLPAA